MLAIFNKYDDDEDGLISIQLLDKILEKLKLNLPKESNRIITSYEKNYNKSSKYIVKQFPKSPFLNSIRRLLSYIFWNTEDYWEKKLK